MVIWWVLIINNINKRVKKSITLHVFFQIEKFQKIKITLYVFFRQVRLLCMFDFNTVTLTVFCIKSSTLIVYKKYGYFACFFTLDIITLYVWLWVWLLCMFFYCGHNHIVCLTFQDHYIVCLKLNGLVYYAVGVT